MKYLFLLPILISFSTHASRFADDIRSFEKNGDEVTVTFSSHSRVHRLDEKNAVIPCLENGFKAKKPVDVIVNDKDGRVMDCKLAPRMHPGAAGH